MRVACIGGTGFIGSYLVDALLAAGHQPRLLVRPGSESKLLQPERCEIVNGSIDQPESLRALLDRCDAVIYNIGILREEPARGITFEALQYEGLVATVNSAVEQDVSRLLLMSANGVKSPGTPYQATKKRAEEYALASALDVTIFRPSVVYGDPRGMTEIATQLYTDMVRPPMPAIAFHTGFRPSGNYVRMSPVHVVDVAAAFVRALDNQQTVGRILELGGAEAIDWRDLLERIAAAAGKRKIILPCPIGLMYLAATLFDRLPSFPVTRDQLTMLAEGNVVVADDLEWLLGHSPREMAPDALHYLQDAAKQ